MRFSKKRKHTEPTTRLNLVVTERSRKILDEIAGHHSLSRAVEALIERENRRIAKKLANSTIKEEMLVNP